MFKGLGRALTNTTLSLSTGIDELNSLDFDVICDDIYLGPDYNISRYICKIITMRLRFSNCSFYVLSYENLLSYNKENQ